VGEWRSLLPPPTPAVRMCMAEPGDDDGDEPNVGELVNCGGE
jgi:hypothetical protein